MHTQSVQNRSTHSPLVNLAIATFITLGIANSACDLDLTTSGLDLLTVVDGDPPSDRPSLPTATEIPLPERITTVLLVNESELAVDTQFFVLNDVSFSQPDDLFADPNQFRRGVGFLSLGVLAPGEIVEVTLQCGTALTIGTTGGQFLDPETGDEVTTGTTRRIATLGPQFDCLDTVTITYNVSASGAGIAMLGL